MTFQTTDMPRIKNSAPGNVTTSAVLAAIMVTTGWAFFAAIPVAIMTITSWISPRTRPLRWWTSLTAAIYAIPFGQYLLREDQSAVMSDLINPYMAAAIAISSLIVLLKILKSHRD